MAVGALAPKAGRSILRRPKLDEQGGRGHWYEATAASCCADQDREMLSSGPGEQPSLGCAPSPAVAVRGMTPTQEAPAEQRRCRSPGWAARLASGYTSFCPMESKALQPQEALQRQLICAQPGCGALHRGGKACGEVALNSARSTSAGSSSASADTSSSASDEAVCLRPGCSKPTWNGQPGEFCSGGCKAPICLRPGCGRLAGEGEAFGYCGAACRPRGLVSLVPRGAASVCLGPLCGRPAWKGQLCDGCSSSGGSPAAVEPEV